MIESIFSGVIANAIFAILIIVIGWIIYYLTERRRLIKFFGIADSKRLVIYISSLRIVSRGSIGVDNIPRSYTGPAVVYNEQYIASKFKERFNYLIPSLSDSPSFLSKILFSDITIVIVPSPLNINEVEAISSIVTLGSPGYNFVSSMIEDNEKSAIKFIQDNRAIQITSIPNITNGANGFIQRLVINNDNKKRSLFYVGGLTELGTVGAANYLVFNWKTLRRKYNDNESFVIVLRFLTSNINNYSIDFERKIE
jgi:hypothetical protein